MENVLNWGRIALYASTLLAAQVAIGFLESSLATSGNTQLVASCAMSFLASVAIFTHLAARQRSAPFVHAWAALILQSLAGAALMFALTHRLDSVPLATVAIEGLVLICALMAGTALGSSWRHRTGKPAGA